MRSQPPLPSRLYEHGLVRRHELDAAIQGAALLGPVRRHRTRAAEAIDDQLPGLELRMLLHQVRHDRLRPSLAELEERRGLRLLGVRVTPNLDLELRPLAEHGAH